MMKNIKINLLVNSWLTFKLACFLKWGFMLVHARAMFCNKKSHLTCKSHKWAKSGPWGWNSHKKKPPSQLFLFEVKRAKQYFSQMVKRWLYPTPKSRMGFLKKVQNHQKLKRQKSLNLTALHLKSCQKLS